MTGLRHPRTMAILVLCLAVLSSAGFAVARERSHTDDRRDGPTIGILGASVSAGFGMFLGGTEDDGPGMVGVRLADVVSAAAPPGAVVSDWSTWLFFRNPVTIGPQAVERLAERSPDVVLAIDFLFWFAYGATDLEGAPIVEERQRHALFERGLELLETFEAPMVVGDLPDMRGADPRMLAERQIPDPPTLARLNARLRQWAATRESVALLPLETIRRTQLAAAPEVVKRRLQSDRLHPTFEGLVAILAAAAPTLEMLRVVVPSMLDSDEPHLVAERLAERILDADAPRDGPPETDDGTTTPPIAEAEPNVPVGSSAP